VVSRVARSLEERKNFRRSRNGGRSSSSLKLPVHFMRMDVLELEKLHALIRFELKFSLGNNREFILMEDN